jgi:L-lactate dehydrogenase complex protein LldF
MTLHATSPAFRENAREALADQQLQKALGNVRTNVVARRAAAAGRLPEFEALRDQARDIRNHVLAHLDVYLEMYERNVIAAGGHVHWARTAEEACRIIVDIAKARGARSVVKGKSMVSEEIGLNAALERAGVAAVETDLGEYIIQLRGETPSHIIMPAVHLNREDVEAEFRRAHTHLPAERNLDEPESLLAEARAELRAKFLAAEVGVTGANFLVAETGTSIIVTNEGNGDLSQSPAEGSCGRRLHREDRADAGGCVSVDACARPLRHGAGHVGLHHAFHRPAPPRRSGRAGGISCGAGR